MRTFGRLLGFLGPYRRSLIYSLALAWMAMGMTVAIPLLLGAGVDAIEEGRRDDILPYALALLGAGMLRLLLTVGRRLVAGKVSLAVEYDLRQTFYEHLQKLELAFFDGQQTGQLMSRATVDLQSIRFFLGYGLIWVTQSALTILFVAAVMLWLDPLLAALALAPVPFLVATATRYSRRNRPAEQEVQQRVGELTANAEEGVAGIRIVKAFARERHMLERFRRSADRVFEQSMLTTRLQSFYTPLMGFLPNVGLAVVLLVGGRQVIDGGLSIGDFTAFYAYLLLLSGPVRWLGMSLNMAQRAVASGNRLFEILDREPSMQSPPGSPALPPGGGRVVIEGVTLRYDGVSDGGSSASRPGPPHDGGSSASRPGPRHDGGSSASRPGPPHDGGSSASRPGPPGPSLTDIDLELEPGRTVALVGPTASGKTSLVGLLARLYDPSEGRVLIDGADLRKVDLASLRSQVAFVADDSFLFSDTVAGNIAYAHPEATREQVEAAARRAQAHGFIAALPDGYDTVVGERGLTLSGGQRQRVAIARALLAEPRILILDDATSSVDSQTEARIKAGLAEAMAGRTTFVVAHRLSTISLADEIVVMDAGRIVDRGTHGELLERCPLYAEIAEKGLEDSVYLQRDLEQRGELVRL